MSLYISEEAHDCFSMLLFSKYIMVFKIDTWIRLWFDHIIIIAMI